MHQIAELQHQKIAICEGATACYQKFVSSHWAEEDPREFHVHCCSRESITEDYFIKPNPKA